MKYKPFSFRPVFIDLLLFALTIAVIGPICILLTMLIHGQAEGTIGLSIYFSLPLIPICFYLIRRQFNWRLTLIHILLTSIIVFCLLYCTAKLLDFVVPDEMGPELNWVMWPSLIIYFVLTKHTLDSLTNKMVMDNKT